MQHLTLFALRHNIRYHNIQIMCLLKQYTLCYKINDNLDNIKINDTMGPLRILMLVGLPQGAVLAPTLFKGNLVIY